MTTTELQGLKVAVDVQHLFRPPPRAHDRGAAFRLMASGATVYEGDVALLYGQALAGSLIGRGADVLTNGTVLRGTYGARNRAAAAWGADAYLACHVNAGGGRYALAECMGASPGKALGLEIGLRLDRSFGAIDGSKVRALHEGDRGAVCISNCPARMAAVILEPFFGDNPAHQGLMIAPRLVAVAEAIAMGVADWWRLSRLEVRPA